MKNLTLSIAVVAAAASMFPVSAQETVKTLYSGEEKTVTWDTPLSIDASQFAEGVNVGNYIYITFSKTSDVIEIKANGTWLPGSRLTNLGDNSTDFKAYITVDMLEALKTYGLEICGKEFTVKEVSICNDGFIMPEGAIWGGYFWVDNWNTLELFKTAFDKYDNQKYLDIYLSDDNGDNIGYFMKVLTKWEDPEAVWADNDQIIHTAKTATVDLSTINVKYALSDVNTLMIQSNPEGGNPYNITAVVLRPGISVVVDNVLSADESGEVNIYNLQGILVETAESLEKAKASLPTGIYIANGKKFAVR